MSARKKAVIAVSVVLLILCVGFWRLYLSDVNAAVKSGELSRVKRALAWGGNANSVDDLGATPLILAAFHGRTDIERFLTSKGADVNERETGLGRSPLHVSLRYPDIAKLLIAYGADLNAKTYDGYTPLHYAAYNGLTAAARMLIAAGSDVNARASNGWRGPLPARSMALGSTGLEGIKAVRTALPEGRGETPLQVSMWRRGAKVARLLIGSGAKLNVTDDEGYTALHEATREGMVAIAKFLISKGANVNARSKTRVTPLHLAAWAGPPGMAEVLLQSGAVVNARNDRGETPLHLAALAGRAAVADVLVRNGADANARNDHGVMPLHYAAGGLGRGKAGPGNIAVAELLISKGANINAKSERGSTPLKAALRCKNRNVADFLRNHGGKL